MILHENEAMVNEVKATLQCYKEVSLCNEIEEVNLID